MNIDRVLITPFQKFVKVESLSGILLFGATIIAMIFANTSLAPFYDSLWQYKIGIQTPDFKLIKPLILWVNDGLMAIFFFVIGLEIKREIMIGELNNMKKASFPIFAALGGMVIPISLFIILNNDSSTSHGWGIPAATDIAFSLAVIQLLGKKVPVSLKVFLAAFAIVDDIGAVVLIAGFYSTGINWLLMIIAVVLILILTILSVKGIYSKYLYFTVGAIVWLLFLKAGFHPTVAGVLLAFTIPLRKKTDVKTYVDKLCNIVDEFREAGDNTSPVLSKEQVDYIDDLEDWTAKVQSPLQHLEHSLHNWVAYLIIPVFAFANAGVNFKTGTGLNYNLIIILIISLFAGKSVGIMLFTWLGKKLGLTEKPEGISNSQLLGIAFIAGMGFTMSIFISNLAFTDNPVIINSARIGIIAGSFISGITGYLILRFSKGKSLKEAKSTELST